MIPDPETTRHERIVSFNLGRLGRYRYGDDVPESETMMVRSYQKHRFRDSRGVMTLWGSVLDPLTGKLAARPQE